MKKGLSFTLTLVVVGVILLMTALSVITLGGSSLNAFFDTIGGQRDQQVQESNVRAACQDLARDINQNYCSGYVATAEYEEGNTNDDPRYQPAEGDYMNSSGDQWNTQNYPDCSAGSMTDNRVPQSKSTADGTGIAHTSTATDASCNWRNNYESTPTVTVEGNTYNCLNEGYISSEICPAE